MNQHNFSQLHHVYDSLENPHEWTHTLFDTINEIYINHMEMFDKINEQKHELDHIDTKISTLQDYVNNLVLSLEDIQTNSFPETGDNKTWDGLLTDTVILAKKCKMEIKTLKEKVY